MIILHVIVNNKVATYLKRDGDIVCGNSDYQIEFTFDEMWDAYTEKTARFIWNNQYVDVDFTGNTCTVPVISNVDSVKVGVYAGDMQTTTSAIIGCKRSVLCGGENQRPESAEKYTNEAKEAASSANESRVSAEHYAKTAEVYRNECRDFAIDAVDIDARVSRNDKRITNLEQGITPEPFVTDDTIAYTKDVPTNALPYATVDRVGGMTGESKNLFNINGDKTSGEYLNLYKYVFTVKPNTKYTVSSNIPDFTAVASIYANGTSSINNGISINKPRVITSDVNGNFFILIRYVATDEEQIDAYTNILNGTYYLQIEEGSVVTEYEPYYEGLRSAKVTELKSMGANLIPFPYVSAQGTFDKGSTYTNNGITYTINEDGSITVNGTAEGNSSLRLSQTADLKAGATYTVSGSKSNVAVILSYKNATGVTDYKNNNSFDWENGYSLGTIYVQVSASTTVNNVTICPMLNKGASAVSYKPYKNLPSFTIPTEIQALEGYGEGIEVELQDVLTGNLYTARSYNYIDFDKRQFIRNVKTIKLSSLAWSKDSGGAYIAKLDEPTKAYTSAGNIVAKAQHYIVQDYHTVAVVGVRGIGISGEDIAVLDSAHGTLTDFIDFITTEDITLCYELATPEIIDISEHITVDNFIEVEGGGTIVAVNGYMKGVPTEITYMVKEATV